jgi:hypothetical protein
MPNRQFSRRFQPVVPFRAWGASNIPRIVAVKSKVVFGVTLLGPAG